jgi:hypothetical protein
MRTFLDESHSTVAMEDDEWTIQQEVSCHVGHCLVLDQQLSMNGGRR